MNFWTKKSVEFASQRNYLDELFKVYPISPNIKRELSKGKVIAISESFENKNELQLISELLTLELFPIKDSYVVYLKRDKTSLKRNPATIKRLASYLYEMGFNEVIEKCIEPKETNRQIGPMFKNWINKGILGIKVYNNINDFLSTKENGILNVSDLSMLNFAQEYLGYTHNKGLDFIARFNNEYVVAEAKFITDFGGHQNAQFADAINTLKSKFIANKLNVKIHPIAILDGVLFIQGNNKMHQFLKNNSNFTIISSLLLREYLFHLW